MTTVSIMTAFFLLHEYDFTMRSSFLPIAMLYVFSSCTPEDLMLRGLHMMKEATAHDVGNERRKHAANDRERRYPFSELLHDLPTVVWCDPKHPGFKLWNHIEVFGRSPIMSPTVTNRIDRKVGSASVLLFGVRELVFLDMSVQPFSNDKKKAVITVVRL